MQPDGASAGRGTHPLSPPTRPPRRAASWVLLDFGLARRYTSDAASGHAPERPEASFRGSTTYASARAHQLRDLSRRDDAWSWLYMVIELVTGDRGWARVVPGAGGGPNGARGLCSTLALPGQA